MKQIKMCVCVFYQYAFLVTSVVQFAGGVVVFFGLLTSPKEVGEFQKEAVSFFCSSSLKKQTLVQWLQELNYVSLYCHLLTAY